MTVEYGFHVSCKRDVVAVRVLMARDRQEKNYLCKEPAMMLFNNQLFLIVTSNHSNLLEVCKWIEKYKDKDLIVLWPKFKPDGWFQCKTFTRDQKEIDEMCQSLPNQ